MHLILLKILEYDGTGILVADDMILASDCNVLIGTQNIALIFAGKRMNTLGVLKGLPPLPAVDLFK